MALKLKDKEKIVVELADYARTSSSAIIANCDGLNANQMNVLRARMYELGIYVKVVRNSLFKRAIKETTFSCMNTILYGSLILMFSKADPVSLSKAVKLFMLDNDMFKVKSLFMSGKLYDLNKINELCRLPSLEGGLVLLCGVLLATTIKFIRTLNEIPMQGIKVLSAIANKNTL